MSVLHQRVMHFFIKIRLMHKFVTFQCLLFVVEFGKYAITIEYQKWDWKRKTSRNTRQIMPDQSCANKNKLTSKGIQHKVL